MAKQEMSNVVEVSMTQMDRILETNIRNGLMVHLVGAPGVGKTSLVEQVCHRLSVECMVSTPVGEEPIDPRGLPGFNEVNGIKQAEFFLFGFARRAMNATKPLVWFIDDLGQAPTATQAAYMHVVTRLINGNKLPECVTFVSASNRKQDMAGVSNVLSPLLNRALGGIYHVSADSDSWSSWALAAGLPVWLISFVRFRPAILTDFDPRCAIEQVATPTPRSVAAVAKLAEIHDEKDHYAVFSGVIGKSWAAEIAAYKATIGKMPSVDTCLSNPGAWEVPDEPGILYALAGALASRAKYDNAERYVACINRLPQDFAVKSWKDVIAREKKRTADVEELKRKGKVTAEELAKMGIGKSITQSNAGMEWLIKHQHLI